MFSTSWDVQYMGDIISTSGMFSTSGHIIMNVGGIPCVHWGMFSTSEKHHEYIGDVQYIRGISRCMWGSNLINPFNFY